MIGKKFNSLNLSKMNLIAKPNLPVSRFHTTSNQDMKPLVDKVVFFLLSVRRPSHRLLPQLPLPPWPLSVKAQPATSCADPQAKNKFPAGFHWIQRRIPFKRPQFLYPLYPTNFPLRLLRECSLLIAEIFTLIKALLYDILHYDLGCHCGLTITRPTWKTEYNLHKHI